MIISKMYMYYFRGKAGDAFAGNILQDRHVIQVKDKYAEEARSLCPWLCRYLCIK